MNDIENSQPPCSFGSINVKTGDYSTGYIENGEMKFKLACNDPTLIERAPSPALQSTAAPIESISYVPVFHSILTISCDMVSSGWFKPTTIHKLNKKTSLYRCRNRLTDKNEYYYNDKYSLPHYIDADAFEKCNIIIFLDDVPWENL